MPTDPKQGHHHTLDGDPNIQVEPFQERRLSQFPSNFEREQSGGLSDDPTESGNPVRNRVPHGPLTGGR